MNEHGIDIEKTEKINGITDYCPLAVAVAEELPYMINHTHLYKKITSLMENGAELKHAKKIAVTIEKEHDRIRGMDITKHRNYISEDMTPDLSD
jgi:hypothetical protein